MGLRDSAAAAHAVVKTSGGEFAVRAIGFDEVHALVKEHKATAMALFDQFADRENLDFGEIIGAALELAPTLAVSIVAHGIDDPDVPDIAERRALTRLLSFSVQMEALEKIADLTFETEGGPKKVLEIVIRALNGTTNLIQSPQEG